MASDLPTQEPINFWEALEARSPRSSRVIRGDFERTLVNEARVEFRAKHGFVPSNVAFSPTYDCNLRCIDCYPNGGEANECELADETIDAAIGESREKWAVPFFTISGGEPLPRVIEIAKRHPEIPFQVYTNGTLITDKVADEIAELGNIFPFISVEGFKEETDRIRGTGVYEKVMMAMDLLTKKGVIWGISFKLTSRNAHVYDGDKFLDELIERGALLGRFLTYMPTGRNVTDAKVPTPNQRKKQAEALRGVIEDGKLFYGLDYLNNPGIVRGCAAAGLRYIHIDPSADVYPCVFITMSARFNLAAAYRGEYERDGLSVSCLEDILLKDPMLKIARQIASTRSDTNCCLVLDNPDEFKKACSELAKEGDPDGL